MMIYNVSCTVNAEIAEIWQTFFLKKHLDDVVNTGCFIKYHFKKELSDKPNKVTFVSEYYYRTSKDLERYQQHFAATLQAEVREKFEGQYECQRTLFSLLSSI